jgi:uncharacterized protein (DUF1330 family)
MENIMPAYSIVGVTVRDQQLFQKYVDGHGVTLAEFGGRFLAAGDDFALIEGIWPGQIVVLHEWPDSMHGTLPNLTDHGKKCGLLRPLQMLF